ncbi:prepilin peptidase CpaA [Liberibacter crescens BT-1]|uniref:Prepilin peptidase CpaA n=1 Tax=Liberibacter crescens (strain BT-1) TaxID=1215343 RepID=L0EX90_LIBCB|nr:prepilin peptidase [Liberibacter crescens]AGA65278.1 prepilin peptidase CpaA [Liberibacter crescens BT-1]AMC13211.1 peptidase [Liberibacter crescens]
MIPAIVFLVVPFCLAVAAFSDLFSTTIPNRVSVVLLGSFVLVLPFMNFEISLIGLHFLAGFILFSFCFFLFAMNIMGGGDVKLLTSMAVWFGWDSSLVEFLIYVSILGGILSLIVVFLRSQRFWISVTGMPIPSSLLISDKIPYGLAIAVAGFISYPDSVIFKIALNGLIN